VTLAVLTYDAHLETRSGKRRLDQSQIESQAAMVFIRNIDVTAQLLCQPAVWAHKNAYRTV